MDDEQPWLIEAIFVVGRVVVGWLVAVVVVDEGLQWRGIVEVVFAGVNDSV